MRIAEFAPEGVEAGVGLALQDEAGRYLFFLAGAKHNCPPGERFYGGIGGHLEPGEDWVACGRREALEEIGVDVELVSAESTWLIDRSGGVRHVGVEDSPGPLALYEMIHPPFTPRAGQVYRLVIYRARLVSDQFRLQPEEVSAVVALTAAQVVQGLDRRVCFGELSDGGAAVVAGSVDPAEALFPIGTAAVLGHVLKAVR